MPRALNDEDIPKYVIDEFRKQICNTFGTQIKDSYQIKDLKESIKKKVIRNTEGLGTLELSEATLKRFFGLVNTEENYRPRRSTYDILARYIGHRSFSDFYSECRENTENSQLNLTPCLAADDLDLNEKLKIHYGKNKIMTLAHLGNKRFRVEEIKNIAGLKIGDIVTISSFAIGFELEVSDIERDLPAKEVRTAVPNHSSSEELIPAGTFFGFVTAGDLRSLINDIKNNSPRKEHKKNTALLSSFNSDGGKGIIHNIEILPNRY